MFYLCHLEPLCDKLLITSSGDSTNIAETIIDYTQLIFGKFEFKYWDARGNAVYDHTIHNLYISKNDRNVWTVSIYFPFFFVLK